MSRVTYRPFQSSLVPLFQNESKRETNLDFDLHEAESVGGTQFDMVHMNVVPRSTGNTNSGTEN